MKLLVANRGEIACRIFETCRLMGIGTVAVYAEDDKNNRHVSVADEAHLLPGNSLAETYLNAELIIDIAKKSGALMIHPGFGFLSENAGFAQKVIDAQLKWVGPSPDVIEKMGSKIGSKQLCDSLGIRTLPWFCAPLSESIDEKKWNLQASKIGYPLLVKASSGGGGRGMRLVHSPTELMEAIESATREAESAFKDGTIFLEKYLGSAKHLEVQILGHADGTISYFGDRECSVQRRHQKVIEEAPVSSVPEQTRDDIKNFAITLASHLNYQSAGTVEFVVDDNNTAYFLEMNTRLQVEHPVSEWITGIDLVEQQIRVALGEKLHLPKEIPLNGYAIECRLYAENPDDHFRPTPGTLRQLEWPVGRNIRIDTGILSGQKISDRYDPMIAKISTWSSTRAMAIQTMDHALEKTVLLGCGHNISFLRKLLAHADFKNNTVTTSWIENIFQKEKSPPLEDETLKNIIQFLMASPSRLQTTCPPSSEAMAHSALESNLFGTIKL